MDALEPLPRFDLLMRYVWVGGSIVIYSVKDN